MLVLTRRSEEVIFLDFSGMTEEELRGLRSGAPIAVAVVEIRGDKVRLGFEAPRSVKVHRKEIFGRDE
jgi:sRNA-binding carbon storage regulator CsrA